MLMQSFPGSTKASLNSITTERKNQFYLAFRMESHSLGEREQPYWMV